MYWAGTLVVGYMSAYSWLLYNQRRTQIRIKDLPAVTAHVIHAGQRGLLIYEPTAKKSDRASSELEHLLKEGLLRIEWVIFVIVRAIPVYDGDAIADW
jgi:hypothetical protein